MFFSGTLSYWTSVNWKESSVCETISPIFLNELQSSGDQMTTLCLVLIVASGHQNQVEEVREALANFFSKTRMSISYHPKSQIVLGG